MNNKTFPVTIMSPLNAHTIQAEWIEANTSTGNFIVLPGHAPLILSLARNKELIIGLYDGTQKTINVVDGILQIDRESVTVFLTQE